jgi:putative ubiquitin-RnfH superfamily antitoxin RatB of RatAB toxin-antitoxin module
MAMTDKIKVEVAYATPEKQLIVALEVAPGTTARQAVLASGIAAQFPGLDAATVKLGIFGKAVADDALLRAQDRVELYRPLLADPKEVRRRRAASKQS